MLLLEYKGPAPPWVHPHHCPLCHVTGCTSGATGVDGKCFYHSEDDLSAASDFMQALEQGAS